MTLLVFFIGLCLGAFCYKIRYYIKKKALSDLGKTIISQAEHQAHERLNKAHEQVATLEQAQKAAESLQEAKLRSKCAQLDQQKVRLATKSAELDAKEKALTAKSTRLTLLENELTDARKATKAELIAEIELECQKELIQHYKRAEFLAAQKAHTLLVDAMQHVTISEHTFSLQLPSQETKAKIIGRDGINYKAFKEHSGVDLIVYDTHIAISCFDTERREVAKVAMQHLINDGRITPQRIQEALEHAKSHTDELCTRLGIDALQTCSITGMHPDLIQLVGKMALRTTASQNLLQHSIEVSQLMGAIARELQLDSDLAKRIGLLHDIGKVQPAKHTMTHALAGEKIALQYGENKLVANGIGAHHDEIDPISLEARLCKPCDALSASRTAARTEENTLYFDRMAEFEAIATSCEGVDKAYVFQGGKELYVFAAHDTDDLTARRLSKIISDKIYASSSQEVVVTVVPNLTYK